MEIEEDTPGANPASVKSDDSSPCTNSGRGSPPPNCAICLGNCRNKSFTDSCLHQFCFSCLLTWSKVKAECPLCKQNFKSIIHNVRSNHQYEEYMVEQRTEEVVERIDISNITQAQRFRYRTTLTLPRRDSVAIQRLLLLADVYPSPAPRTPLARRRRSPASFRRTVYRHALWARPLPDFTGRFRDCSPEFYRYNDAQMHRLVPWLNRELFYLLNENVAHIAYVLTRILELLPQYHINSSDFREALRRYFGDRTEHFLHELYCFASTPYDLPGYDRNVQYTTDPRISTMVNEVISSSESEGSVDSDIVMVSHSEPAVGSTPPPPAPGPSRPQPHENLYGISYNIPDQHHNVIPIETISHSDTDDDSEVMVVGYIKPPQERTPEVVDLLGSDSDVVLQDNPQPGPSQPSDVSDSRNNGAPLVKLTLKRHMPIESDSDDSFVMEPHKRSRTKESLRRWSFSSSSSSSSWSSSCSSSSTSSSSSSSTSSSWSYNSADSDSSSIELRTRGKTKKKRSKTRTKPARPTDKGKQRKSQKRKKSQATRSRIKDRKSNGKKSRTKSSKKTNVSMQCSERALTVASEPCSSSMVDDTHTIHRNTNQSNTIDSQFVSNDLTSGSFSCYDLNESSTTTLPKAEEESSDSFNAEMGLSHNQVCSTSGYKKKIRSKSRNHKKLDETNNSTNTCAFASPMPSTSEQFSSETLHIAMNNVFNEPCSSGYANKIKIKRKSRSNNEVWEHEANTSTLPMSPKPSTSEPIGTDNSHIELTQPNKMKKRSHKRKSDIDNETRKKNKGKKKKSKRSTSRELEKEKSRKHKKKRSSSGESRRLKSVVNVINSNQVEAPSETPSNSNLLNVLSVAILNPHSNVLSYNSDSGSIHNDSRNIINSELIGRAESCFNIETPELDNINSQSNETESDDDLPLNYSLK